MSLHAAMESSFVRHPEVGRSWLVAVSGGPDSMALLRTALAVASRVGTQVHCGHVDHQLREESGEDAMWVVGQCESLGIRCQVEKVAVDGNRGAIEETARRVRYEALSRMAAQCETTAILTGHTADDQAETVLHHLFRGTGLRGLVGIPECRPLGASLHLWRPLLAVRRSELHDELQRLQQPYRIDKSNSSAAYTRNRVRNELIPWIERELNPRAVDAILRLSEQSAETQDWLAAQANELLDRALVPPDTDTVRLRADLLHSVPSVVARECFVQLWSHKDWPRQAMTREHWQRLVDLCSPAAPLAIQMPGAITARRRGELLVMTAPEALTNLADRAPDE